MPLARDLHFDAAVLQAARRVDSGPPSTDPAKPENSTIPADAFDSLAKPAS
jgi:hypothetical protein